jgi:hypothetical protein
MQRPGGGLKMFSAVDFKKRSTRYDELVLHQLLQRTEVWDLEGLGLIRYPGNNLSPKYSACIAFAAVNAACRSPVSAMMDGFAVAPADNAIFAAVA